MFKIGQKWKNRNGDVRVITDIDGGLKDYPIWSYTKEHRESFTLDGHYLTGDTSARDLIELIEDVKEESTDQLPLRNDPTRTAFIDKLITEVFARAAIAYGPGLTPELTAVVYDALRLRDELVRGDEK